MIAFLVIVSLPVLIGDVVVAEQAPRPVRGGRRDRVRATRNRLARSARGAEGDLAGAEIGAPGSPLSVVVSAGSTDPYTFVLSTADTDAAFLVIVSWPVLTVTS